MNPLHLAFARPLCLLERPTGAIHCFRNRKAFQRLLVLFKGFPLRLWKSFFCLSAWRSSIIPHPPPPCQHFLTDFFHSFLRAPQNSSRPQEKLRRSCNAAAAAKAEESSPGTIQVFRIFAGSARLQQPAWAAFRSGQWVPDPIHCNSCLPGSSKPQTALPPH